jgi:putative transcriptional regulator
MTIEQALFDDLVQSLKEAKAIARGEVPAARRTKIAPPDVKAVRGGIGLSQVDFARLMRVSVRTPLIRVGAGLPALCDLTRP